MCAILSEILSATVFFFYKRLFICLPISLDSFMSLTLYYWTWYYYWSCWIINKFLKRSLTLIYAIHNLVIIAVELLLRFIYVSVIFRVYLHHRQFRSFAWVIFPDIKGARRIWGYAISESCWWFHVWTSLYLPSSLCYLKLWVSIHASNWRWLFYLLGSVAIWTAFASSTDFSLGIYTHQHT